MATPFIGEIKAFAGNFPPRGYALCNGQLLPIAQYTPLFALIGTTYGGDGQNTFALPNLQGRAILHMGTARSGTPYVEGQTVGSETASLNQNQIPQHNHTFAGSTNVASTNVPGTTATLAAMPAAGSTNFYAPAGTGTTPLAATAVSTAGGNDPHENRQPYLAINYVIALEGVFPSRA